MGDQQERASQHRQDTDDHQDIPQRHHGLVKSGHLLQLFQHGILGPAGSIQVPAAVILLRQFGSRRFSGGIINPLPR